METYGMMKKTISKSFLSQVFHKAEIVLNLIMK